MGSCGCGDYAPTFQLPGPDGLVYTLSFYTGCEGCRMPPGLILHRHSPQEAEVWSTGDLPQPKWVPHSDYDPTDAQCFLATANLKLMAAAIAERLKADNEADPDDQYARDDCGRRWLAEVLVTEFRVYQPGGVWWPEGDDHA